MGYVVVDAEAEAVPAMVGSMVRSEEDGEFGQFMVVLWWFRVLALGTAACGVVAPLLVRWLLGSMEV